MTSGFEQLLIDIANPENHTRLDGADGSKLKKFRNCNERSGGRKPRGRRTAPSRATRGGEPCDANSVARTITSAMQEVMDQRLTKQTTGVSDFDLIFSLKHVNSRLNDDDIVANNFDQRLTKLYGIALRVYECPNEMRAATRNNGAFREDIQMLFQLTELHVFLWFQKDGKGVTDTKVKEINEFVESRQPFIITADYVNRLNQKFDNTFGNERRSEMRGIVTPMITGTKISVPVVTTLQQLRDLDVRNSYVSKADKAHDPASLKSLKTSPILFEDIEFGLGSENKPYLLLVEPPGSCGYIFEELLFYTKAEIEGSIRRIERLPEGPQELLSPLTRAPVIAAVDVMAVAGDSGDLAYRSVIDQVNAATRQGTGSGSGQDGGSLPDLKKRAKRLGVRLTKTIAGKRAPKTEKELRRHVAAADKKLGGKK